MHSPVRSLIKRRGWLFAGVAVVVFITTAVYFLGQRRALPETSQVVDNDTIVFQIQDEKPSSESLMTSWRALQQNPEDVSAAADYARRALMRFAVEGDSRALAYADGALAAWRDVREPPAAIWLLRGRILQSRHQFVEAGRDLDRLASAHGSSPEVLLLAADAWRRSGDIGRARSRCVQLALSGWQELSRLCAADILLSLGQEERAYQLIFSDDFAAGMSTPSTRQWGYAVKADVALAAGHPSIARTLLEQALEIPDASIALHAAYADVLLEAGLVEKANTALLSLPDADAILLRRGIASKRLDAANFGELRARLRARFVEAADLQTAGVHLREQALFELLIEDDPIEALALAEENWTLQKGPEDALLLIQAASSAGKPEASDVVHVWRMQYATPAG